MRYRVTALTPLLVGNGEQLSPIDYMVYRDQVSVLDQNRIFRLLSKGPRLEGYLTQLRRATKLDFASWGGFAQNYSSYKIPFEHPSAAQAWEQARIEDLFIPTFNAGAKGPYLTGSSLKGALRTSYVFANAEPKMLEHVAAKAEQDRVNYRRLADEAEYRTAGVGLMSRMRPIQISDSAAVGRDQFKIYLVRTAKLVDQSGKFGVSYKPTPMFAEMAAPGAQFEGQIGGQVDRFADAEVLKAFRWKEPVTIESMAEAANRFAQQLLQTESLFANRANLAGLGATVVHLLRELDGCQSKPGSCLLPLGWGGGFLTKTAFGNPETGEYRKVLKAVPFYQKAIQSGMPFPKTRRIVQLAGQPASIPGWVKLELAP